MRNQEGFDGRGDRIPCSKWTHLFEPHIFQERTKMLCNTPNQLIYILHKIVTIRRAKKQKPTTNEQKSGRERQSRRETTCGINQQAHRTQSNQTKTNTTKELGGRPWLPGAPPATDCLRQAGASVDTRQPDRICSRWCFSTSPFTKADRFKNCTLRVYNLVDHRGSPAN